MKPASSEPDEPRGCRFIIAVMMLCLLGLVFWATASGVFRRFQDTEWASGSLKIILYFGYLALQGCLLVRLTRVLYRHHELKQFKFSIEGLLLLMTMVSLMLGTARLAVSGISENASSEFVAATIVLMISLFPLLAVCEAFVVWTKAVRKSKQTR
ncbi:MAG: hypothetical protein R3C05_04130 [Pirellulaceae bacterium]